MSRTDCPRPETLAAFTLGDLPEAELSAVAEHLEVCTECEEQASRLDGMADPVVSQLRRLPNPYLNSDEPDTEPAGSGETLSLPESVESWGEFRIVREIGRGGMGVVCEAYQGSLNRHVALKFLPEHGDLARFRREARAAGRLHHTNIVPVFGVSEDQGRHFYVMQFIAGHGLDAVAKKRAGARGSATRFDDREAARIGVQVAEALAYAHSQGIMHRDIKPSNLLLDDQHTVWVTDFGLAHDASDTLTLTQTGDFLGTLRYVAPERLSGRGDERADIYGLGVTIYELVCGRPAYAEGDRSVLVHQILHQDPPRPRQIHPAIARDLETIVVKAMERDPAQRYATADALAEDLRRFLEDRTIRARRIGPWERAARWTRRNKIVAALLGAVFLLLATMAIVATIGEARTRRALSGEAAQRKTAVEAEADARGAANRAIDAERAMRIQWYASSVSLMQTAWESGQARRLRDLLAATEVHQDRGFEWYYWQRQTHRAQHEFIGHSGQVRAVAWAPSGKFLATAGGDGTARIWDASGRPQPRILRGHAGEVWSVAFSRDGRQLATGSLDGSAKVWNCADGRLVRTLRGREGEVGFVSWSPDGKQLAGRYLDGGATVWDIDDGREALVTPNENGDRRYPRPLAWESDGERLAIGNCQGSVQIWNIAERRIVFSYPAHTGAIVSMNWSPDGKRLITSGEDGRVRVWNAERGTRFLELRGHTAQVVSVAWSKNGRFIATGSYDGTARVWDATTGTEVAVIPAHRDQVHCVAWSPDSQKLATGGKDGTARVWRIPIETGPLVLKGHKPPVYALSWSPDGRFVATGGLDTTAKVWDAGSGREQRTFHGHHAGVLSIDWSPDGKSLASGDFAGIANVWDPATGQERLRLAGHTQGISAVAWSPNGRLIATASRDTTSKVWDAATGRELMVLKEPTLPVSSISWSQDGTRLATGGADGRARVWDALGGQELFTIRHHSILTRPAAWSPDGTRLATGSAEGPLWIWDTHDGHEVLRLDGHAGEVYSIAWSPDGKRLASASRDHTARIWDPSSGLELLSLKARACLRAVAWSRDGRRLATAGESGTAEIWDAADQADVDEWSRRDRLVQQLILRDDFRDPRAPGFLREWLVLLPLPLEFAKTGTHAPGVRQLPDLARLHPKPGDRVIIQGIELAWRELHSASPVLDFSAIAGQARTPGVCDAICFLNCARPRDDLWLQVGGDDEVIVHLNGREIYRSRASASLEALVTTGPLSLLQGTNVLRMQVVNESRSWEACARLIDNEGRPAPGIRNETFHRDLGSTSFHGNTK